MPAFPHEFCNDPECELHHEPAECCLCCGRETQRVTDDGPVCEDCERDEEEKEP